MYTPGFIIKKVLTALLQFPGLFLAVLATYTLFLFRKGRRREGGLIIVLLLSIYVVSCPFLANRFIASVEVGSLPYSAYSQCDVIILLGGGLEEGVADLSGTEVLSSESIPRLLNAARLYNRLKVPIIVSGGSPPGSVPEAQVTRRFFLELGIPENMIITESQSMDTEENAQYCGKIMNDRGFTKAVLITSAFHIRRASLLFFRNDIPHIPSGSKPMGELSPPLFLDFLPSAFAMRKTSLAVKEYLGLLFYTLN